MAFSITPPLGGVSAVVSFGVPMKVTVAMNRNYQFQRMYQKASSIPGKFVVLYHKKNRLAGNRLGITVSKKVGKAVHRNRVRRLIKENYRLMEEKLCQGYDLVIVARVRAKDANFYEIRASMQAGFSKANLWKEGNRM